MSLLNKWKKLLAIKSIARYICYQEIFVLEGKFLACENSRFSLLFARGGHFRNFWVGMCRWAPGTLNLYQS